MLEAERSPNEYSPVVPLPDVAGIAGSALVGRKIEARLMVGDGDGESYLHCFEGTIKAFAGASAKKAAKWGCGKRCAVAHVEWDEELKGAARRQKYAAVGGAGRYPIPLDDDFYAKENKHMGWNLLSEGFVEYQRGAEAGGRAGRGGEVRGEWMSKRERGFKGRGSRQLALSSRSLWRAMAKKLLEIRHRTRCLWLP